MKQRINLKVWIYAMLVAPLVLAVFSSCNDDEENIDVSQEIKDGWTYFDDEKTVAFEGAVGQVHYFNDEGRYGILLSNKIIQPLPWGGAEDGVVYLIYGEDELSEELEDLEGKTCIFSGSYQKIKVIRYGTGGTMPCSTTYYKTIISEICEYHSSDPRSRVEGEVRICGTEIPEHSDFLDEEGINEVMSLAQTASGDTQGTHNFN